MRADMHRNFSYGNASIQLRNFSSNEEFRQLAKERNYGNLSLHGTPEAGMCLKYFDGVNKERVIEPNLKKNPHILCELSDGLFSYKESEYIIDNCVGMICYDCAEKMFGYKLQKSERYFGTFCMKENHIAVAILYVYSKKYCLHLEEKCLDYVLQAIMRKYAERI